MKIGIILYPTYGGSGVVATELGVALASRGHEVHFFSTSRPFRLPQFQPNTYFHEVPVVHYALFEHTPYTLTLSTTLYEAIQNYGIELIHSHYAIPHAAAAYLAQQMNDGAPPIITTLHGTDITLVGSHPAYAPVVRFTLNQSDRVTAVSQFLAEETCKRINFCGKIDVVPNFIDTEYYKRSTCHVDRKKLAPNGEPIILHISNFRPVKRLQDIVNAFIKVRRKKPCKLLLAGDGPERSAAEHTAREGGVINDVMFLGNQPIIVDLLSLADVYFVPSETESFCLSALEAMSCEVPVVATRVGGIPEVVTDGECGYLTSVGDTDDMAARILHLIENPEAARKMGRAGRQRAIDHFKMEMIVARYESLYQEAIEESRSCQQHPDENPSMSSKSKTI
jgi:N-acetyl-alpha-D-glucosaminyl L-malate synthase BshA